MSGIDVSKIPADVMETATKIAETVCRNLDQDDFTVEVKAIAIGLLEERAACAQHAFAMRWAPPLELQGTKEAGEISKITTSWSQQVGMGILNR